MIRFFERLKDVTLSLLIEEGKLPWEYQWAKMAELALRHTDFIRHHAELYYSKVPCCTCGTSIGAFRWDFTIGQLIDIWENVPQSVKTCPHCGHKIYLGNAGGTLGSLWEVYECSDCLQRWDSNNGLATLHFLTEFRVPLKATRELDKERGLDTEGLEYEAAIERLLALDKEPYSDEYKKLPKVSTPIFPTDLLSNSEKLKLEVPRQ